MTSKNQPHDKSSILTNQARIMTQLMSLDECDMDTGRSSAINNDGGTMSTNNPRSPQSQQMHEGQQRQGGLVAN